MTKELRVVVNDDLLARLDTIRAFYASNNNADAIRSLITDKYHEIIDKQKDSKKI